MELSQALELGDFIIKFAVVPLVAALWQVNGRLSKIEGKLEVVLSRHDDLN